MLHILHAAITVWTAYSLMEITTESAVIARTFLMQLLGLSYDKQQANNTHNLKYHTIPLRIEQH